MRHASDIFNDLPDASEFTGQHRPMNTTEHKLASITKGGFTFTIHADIDENDSCRVINQWARCTPEGSAFAEEIHGDACWSIVTNCVMNETTESHWTLQADLMKSAALSLRKLRMLKNEMNNTKEQ